ncbi:MAG TPA: DUF3482 domain-containing protein [Burkholderiales bacterium]|nr:DUF3482 domain-containing protein [Burkholderiales bacterium]
MPVTVTLSLISHTNVGKTALARTLLRRDVGEVRDAPHVTEIAEAHEMISTPEGDRLLLWDTPGFGDSARLLKRLKQMSNPIGWLLSAVWDRFADRPFWCSQQAIKNVRDDADIVLYLVSAAEAPADAGYVQAEMEILGWLARPIVVVLNQLGPPRGRIALAQEEAVWRAHFSAFPHVKDVVPLDAFARCWVQELELLQRLTPLVPEEKQEAYRRLAAAWSARNEATFEAAMHALAQFLTRAARDRESLNAAEQGVIETVARVIGLGADDAQRAEHSAARQLAERLDQATRASTDELAALYGLESHASGEILEELARHVEATRPLNTKRASLLGGVVTGALSGLVADIATGGLSFGAATLAGAIAGAAGGRFIAHEYNKMLGVDATELTWSDEFLGELTRGALLRYLAVAHYGRARGAYVESTKPAQWDQAIGAITDTPDPELTSAIAAVRDRADSSPFEALLATRTRAALGRLYPDAGFPRRAG